MFSKKIVLFHVPENSHRFFHANGKHSRMQHRFADHENTAQSDCDDDDETKTIIVSVFSSITGCPKVKYHLHSKSWSHSQLHLARMMQKKFLVKILSMMKLERYLNAD